MKKGVSTMTGALIASALVALSPTSSADTPQPTGTTRDARLMWEAFKCSTYYEHMKQTDDQAKAFTIAYEAGQMFYTALTSGGITAEQVRREAPLNVAMRSQGPTIEFILGRVFADASRDAFDELSEVAGTDETVQEIEAGNKAREANCNLLIN